MIRQRVLALTTLAMVIAALGVLPACGSTNSQLATTITASQQGNVSPGDTPSYKVKVINKGPGSVTGVTLHVDLPPGFKYKATTATGGTGSERTQLTDAREGSPTPEWGLWSLPAPSTNADGTTSNGELDLTFSVDVSASPGSYSIQARASSDSSDSDAPSAPLGVTVTAAPHLSMQLAASPGNVHPNAFVTYTVTVTNDGTGPANGVTILVTLAGEFEWINTTGISGNSSQQNLVTPIESSSLVDYGGFTIPARSDAGPGVLTITFRAQCVPTTPSGSYPASAQLTTPDGLVVVVRNTVPINVVA